MKFSKAQIICFAALACIASFQSCAALKTQFKSAYAFTQCEFKLLEVQNLRIGTIVISELNSVASYWNSLKSLQDMEELPLEFSLRIQARNPNSVAASMNRLEWILGLDDVEVVSGALDEKVTLPPGPVSVAEFKINLKTELNKLVTSNTFQAMKRLASSVLGIGTESAVLKAKIKPTIEVLGVEYTVKEFIEVKKEFSKQASL